jgi:DNA-binding NarL/FixJ family response regulator
VRVVLADDTVLLRAGVAELLRLEGLEVVGEAGDAEELLALVRSERPDVAVVDVRMPPTHTVEGLEAARQLRQEHGTALGELIAESSVGIGYLLKDRVLSPRELADAVRRVGSGGSAIDPQVVTHLLRRRHDDRGLESLTEREREVLALVAEGHSNRSVAAQLFISEKTVEGAITRIFDKLGLADSPEAHRRVQAVLAWLRS